MNIYGCERVTSSFFLVLPFKRRLLIVAAFPFNDINAKALADFTDCQAGASTIEIEREGSWNVTW